MQQAVVYSKHILRYKGGQNEKDILCINYLKIHKSFVKNSIRTDISKFS
jgi:hypothetical protein